MTEVLLGQARYARLGNDLFWCFIKYEPGKPGSFIDLTWTGYNDYEWWTKWRKGTEVKEQGGRRFRIDYESLNVYEMFEDRADASQTCRVDVDDS